MNILYLAHRIPFPPDKGDKLRAFRHLAHLAKRHCVWCVCFVDDPQDEQHIETLSKHCKRVIAVPLDRRRAKLRGILGLLTGSTVTEAFYRNHEMDKALQELSSVSFDVVTAFSSGMAQHALKVRAKRRVLDLCDLDSAKWLAYAEHSGLWSLVMYRIEGKRLARREHEWIDLFDATTLITEAEARDVDGSATNKKVRIVGNGVPLPDITAPIPDGDDHGIETVEPVVGFVGQMDYKPNVDAVCWFVHNCWPAITAVFPGARFRIVGRAPARSVRRLARVGGVEVAGGVRDVTAELRHFDMSVAPLRIARGLQNKVLEAMAAGRPVVLTSQAAEGIAGRNGRDFLIADDPSNMAGCVIRLLKDAIYRAEIGRCARTFVEKHHRWEKELAKFERVVTGCPSSDLTSEAEVCEEGASWTHPAAAPETHLAATSPSHMS